MAQQPPALFSLIFCAVAGLFIAVGATLAVTQARRVARARPTPAVVVASAVESHRDHDGTTWSPRVVFRYRAGGAGDAEAPERTATAALPLGFSAGRAWADGIVARFPAGAETTAWVDPEHPDQAFLVREVAFFPYFFVLFPMLHFSVGAGLFVGARRGARRAWGAVALAWWGVGAAAFAHFLAVGGSLAGQALVAGAVYAAIGVVPLLVWRRLRRRDAATAASA